jgi:UDPglucose 6-dehydrogenase
VDPQGRREGEALLPGVKWVENPYQAAHGAHLLVLLTEWNEFRALDLAKMVKKMEVARMADLRNVYSDDEAKEAGFETYVGIGR